jgi:hypothetical protein
MPNLSIEPTKKWCITTRKCSSLLVTHVCVCVCVDYDVGKRFWYLFFAVFLLQSRFKNCRRLLSGSAHDNTREFFFTIALLVYVGYGEGTARWWRCSSAKSNNSTRYKFLHCFFNATPPLALLGVYVCIGSIWLATKPQGHSGKNQTFIARIGYM